MERMKITGLKTSKIKTLMLLSLVLFLLIALVVKFYATPIFITLSSPFSVRRSKLKQLNLKYPPLDYRFSDPHYSEFYNLILEEEALRIETCQDIKQTASVRNSVITITNCVNCTYNIGDEIRATITLYDGYNRRKYSGGDNLKARIENKLVRASAPCMVADNADGSDMVVCQVLWSGTSTIIATLEHTREAIATYYRIRTQDLGTAIISGMFNSRNYSEVTTCHPNHTILLNKTSYKEICNFTNVNTGMPFYCGKPTDKHLFCSDWQFVGKERFYTGFEFTECEESLLKSGKRTLNQTVTIDVRQRNGSTHVVESPSIPCSEYNFTLLWQSRELTGFFYNGTWNLRKCLGFNMKYYAKCLKNRHLYLFGDSTTRQWYNQIVNRFKCVIKQRTGPWTQVRECFNKEIQFKAGQYVHAQPFFSGSLWYNVSFTSQSIARRIENIPRNERAIVIIHIYIHVLPFNHSVFKQRMEIIRKSVETFLEKNNVSIVMIKGPHTFEETSQLIKFRHTDYLGNLYSKITYDVFKGLHDRVVLLNNKDITIAQPLKRNHHPPLNIVNAMLDQMLSYACNQ